MNFSADLSEFVKLGQDLVGAAVQSDRNIAHAIDEIAPKIEAEILEQVPVSSIEHAHLKDSVGTDRIGPAQARVGYVKGDAAWRGHFLEDGTAHSAPHAIVRPAGSKFEAEFARAVLAGPFWKP